MAWSAGKSKLCGRHQLPNEADPRNRFSRGSYIANLKMGRSNRTARQDDCLSINFPPINDLINVIYVPYYTNLSIFRSQLTRIDANDSIYRAMIVVGYPHVGFEDMVRPTTQNDWRPRHAGARGRIYQIVTSREAYQIWFGRDATSLPNWKSRRPRSERVPKNKDIHTYQYRYFFQVPNRLQEAVVRCPLNYRNLAAAQQHLWLASPA